MRGKPPRSGCLRRHRFPVSTRVRRGPPPARVRGAAIVTVLLIVALTTVVVSSLFWRQNVMMRSVSNRLALAQVRWIERAAVDYARLVLRNDLIAQHDSLDELWAQPVEDTRLDETITGGARIDSDQTTALLAGQIIDAQSRLNLNNLSGQDGALNQVMLEAVQRLLQSVGKSEALATLLAARVIRSFPQMAKGQLQQVVPASALPLKRIQDLRQVSGFDEATIMAIEAYVTFLPRRGTMVNLNTAQPEVLAALVPKLGIAGARAFALRRRTKPLNSVGEAVTETGMEASDWNGTGNVALFEAKSSFFLLDGTVRYDRVESRTVTLLERGSDPRFIEVKWQDHY